MSTATATRTTTKKPIITTVGLTKTFGRGETAVPVIEAMDVMVGDGDFTCIMGPSGSGKSTLLYALSGMDKPTGGQVLFDGRDITVMSSNQLARFRAAECGFVFQQTHLVDSMDVLDNVLAAGLLTGRRSAVVPQAKQVLETLGLDRTLWRRFPGQLSGGEAQRVGVARAVVNSPRVLFADEPTGALNSAAATGVLDALSSLHTAGQTVVMVTHDAVSAQRAQRVLYLRDGAVVGQLHLDPYRGPDPGRQQRTRAFLQQMGW
ncbi:MAG: ABC transporter ATP-binding protein [Micrococcales bacterium]|nr:ABC transporter ATP-binding protein [Micrococcales bacterium]